MPRQASACTRARCQLSTDELAVWGRWHSHRSPKEALEANIWLLVDLWALEHELVHVVIEMLCAHVCEVSMREPRLEALRDAPEPLARRPGPIRAWPVSCPHHQHLRARLHHPPDEPIQVVPSVIDPFNPHSADLAVAVSKRSSKFETTTACQLSRLATKVEHNHADLDFAAQSLVVPWSHYAPELVHPSPGCLVAGESHLFLNHSYADGFRVLCHHPGHPEPMPDWRLGTGKDRPRDQRRLVPAPRALHEPALSDRPPCPAATTGADETIRPAELPEVLPAIRFRRLLRQPIRRHQPLRLPELCGEHLLGPPSRRIVGSKR